MNVATGAEARRFWLGVLTGGGLTTVPRWSREPRQGVAEHVEPVPAEVAEALRQHFGPLGGAPLVAAHAVVLAALSGEREVTTGFVAGGASPLPLRLDTEPLTWRAVVERAGRAQEQLLAHRDFPVDALAAELGSTAPLFEVELDPRGIGAGPAAGSVLQVSLCESEGRTDLRLRYRAEVLDAEAAARIAGYHVTALTFMAAGPDAEHASPSLLSAQEYAYQIDGLAGPSRELPDERFHELFERRVATHPDAVAAEHADRQWTYRELNSRANQVARALLARGLRREGVVAVVTERNLDWFAAVLAIFKAGGVYLPIEPHFPADRIAKTLTRAECAFALTEPGSDVTLRQAIAAAPGPQVVMIEDVYGEGHPEHDLGTPVAPDQLAYIYFTSGSTGEPKGAMCEHAGMTNHLYAKVEDLGMAEGAVVAQTAPQCFDISLWQLVSALLVGGRTVIVPQEVILDVERFVETITARRVAVMQLVPSYLEVIATYMEQRRHELPDLRVVSATGEALKYELIQRWFAVAPRIPLVNAYGLTETSDDTNHEVMWAPPESGTVALGRAVRNVRVYVVDENLEPVPLGAPGLIVFSGVCVGRGYVNDPERTRTTYMTDPHRRDQRLYKGGDYGRWNCEGKLEFLGRRDNQVKIRGFRIEIGEIDNALLGVPGVRDGAVVVTEGDQGKHLVAFYAADRTIDPAALAAHIAEKLPEYMVPSAFHRLESLPLTANGKIDTKGLRALATELAAPTTGEVEPPVTPTEEMLAAAFAKALDVPVEQIGRHDDFFERGGTSLTAVKLAIASGRAVSLKDVAAQPVLSELAALIDRRSVA
ncbi:amino acid adenylation domain-containing protein [Actinomycetes bacterium KLBMP 9759]